MRTFAVWGFALFVAAALCVVVLTWFWRLEEVRVEYRNIAEARDDGFDRRGWMPCFMPNSASAISEAHDLDSNASAGVFRFGSEHRDFLRDRLAPAELAGVTQPRIKPRRWPRDVEVLLTDGGRHSELQFQLMYAQCDPSSDATSFFVAIDWASQTIAYWSR